MTEKPEESVAEDSAQKISKAELEVFGQLLTRLRNKVSGNVESLSEEGRQPIPLNDENIDIFDRELALDVAGNEQDLLFEIDDALRRIDEGTYGLCEATGKPIKKERLKAIPYARYCLEAQAEMEAKQHPPPRH